MIEKFPLFEKYEEKENTSPMKFLIFIKRSMIIL